MSSIQLATATQSALPRAVFQGATNAGATTNLTSAYNFPTTTWQAIGSSINNITLGSNSSFTVTVTGNYTLQLSVALGNNASTTALIPAYWQSTKFGTIGTETKVIPSGTGNVFVNMIYVGHLIAGDIVIPQLGGTSSQTWFAYTQNFYSISCNSRLV